MIPSGNSENSEYPVILIPENSQSRGGILNDVGPTWPDDGG
jgi:hypothetical protein